MTVPLSLNTQAILLLTAPLIVGSGQGSHQLLTLGEYGRLARFLREVQRQPSDFVGADAEALLRECDQLFPADRLRRLLDRGFLLSQAVDRWQARSIWILSRADGEYPKRLKARLRDDAPPILYGCGEQELLNAGGLAVVGSRDAADHLLNYAAHVGHLAAAAHRAIVSGGARGIDQAAMRGALVEGGSAVGILSDSLERASMNRENRAFLMDRRLLLCAPFDPSAGFNVGNAMQRNKYIYALSDAALVVCSDHRKGGTWAGATEQIQKFRFAPVYAHRDTVKSRGIEALHQMGASIWPDPKSPGEFVEVLSARPAFPSAEVVQNELPLVVSEHSPDRAEAAPLGRPGDAMLSGDPARPSLLSDVEPFAKVLELLHRLARPMTETEVAEELQITKPQARASLKRLVEQGAAEKLSRPVRYQTPRPEAPWFAVGE
jgi:DNA processing protein